MIRAACGHLFDQRLDYRAIAIAQLNVVSEREVNGWVRVNLVHATEEVVRGHLEGACESAEVVERWASCSCFEMRDGGRLELGPCCEFGLAQAAQLPDNAQPCRKILGAA